MSHERWGKSGARVRFSTLVFLAALPAAAAGVPPQAAAKEVPSPQGVLASFEGGIPCSDQGDAIGFRKIDLERARIAPEGAGGSSRSATFLFDAKNYDIYLQGAVRRRYLWTGSEKYQAGGPNLLTFWVKLPADSPLIGREQPVRVGDRVIGRKLNNNDTMTVMTYHWRQGDQGVGGKTNRELLTDSNMHGYSEFRFTEKAAGRWVKVALSPSAFRLSRNYFHFYGAAAITDDLELFASLRQLQFRVEARLEIPLQLQIDEIRLERQPPTAKFDAGFHAAKVPAKGGDFPVPVTLRNPTDHERRYRVFISSFLGAERELLNQIAALTDDLSPMRQIQSKVGADGGIGAAELVGEDGTRVTGRFKEIVIPPGGAWKGTLVHHVKPEMLRQGLAYHFRDYEFPVRRDTLTTSVIVWDPRDPANSAMDFLAVRPHNADDANHNAPSGFPKQQARPAEGWRSEDIPYNQVGGYFVSVLTLTD